MRGYHGADFGGDVLVAEGGGVDVELSSSRRRTGLLVDGGAVAAEDAAEKGWKTAGCGGFFVIIVDVSVRLRRTARVGGWRWWEGCFV